MNMHMSHQDITNQRPRPRLSGVYQLCVDGRIHDVSNLSQSSLTLNSGSNKALYPKAASSSSRNPTKKKKPSVQFDESCHQSVKSYPLTRSKNNKQKRRASVGSTTSSRRPVRPPPCRAPWGILSAEKQTQLKHVHDGQSFVQVTNPHQPQQGTRRLALFDVQPTIEAVQREQYTFTVCQQCAKPLACMYGLEYVWCLACNHSSRLVYYHRMNDYLPEGVDKFEPFGIGIGLTQAWIVKALDPSSSASTTTSTTTSSRRTTNHVSITPPRTRCTQSSAA